MVNNVTARADGVGLDKNLNKYGMGRKREL